METTKPVLAWVFDSSKCLMLGHRIGCQAVPSGEIGQQRGRLKFAGNSAENPDDIGHPVKMCKCTKDLPGL